MIGGFRLFIVSNGLPHAEQFDLKRKRGVRGDVGWVALGTVAQSGRYNQAPLAADFHRLQRLVPAWN
jgi:hypothetical protein